MLEEDLSPAEKLYLWRIRATLNLRAAAQVFGVSTDRYRSWEHGGDGIPDIDLQGLDPPEHYTVLRLRSGKTRQQVASDMGVSVIFLMHMERGLRPIDRLIQYWGE